jgi:rod shape determining protein RodA
MTPWKPQNFLSNLFKVDWIMLGAALLLSMGGLSTMHSFSGGDSFFSRQIAWLFFSVLMFFTFSLIDWRFFKKSETVFSLFLLTFLSLTFLLILGQSVRGAERWLDLGIFSIQISDPAKIVLIIVLAKYFSRRHVEIAHFKHIIVSALYAFIFFILIFLQPDLSSSIIIFLIWFGMVMVSGISKKHILSVIGLFLISLTFLWSFVLLDYQKQRIVTFLNPLTDIQGTGYNAMQSVIAVGSGQIFGKGIGFGTQSRLRFLPEYQTDFIFAAFAEEWGLIGVLIMFSLFGVLIWRVVVNALKGLTNFEILFGAGVAIFIISQFTINVGMNIGLLPVTGTPLPFLSYGGSHLVTEFAALGILAGMRKYNRTFHKEETGEKVLV